MRRSAISGLVIALSGAGCVVPTTGADERDLEVDLQAYALEMGLDPEAGEYDGEHLTLAGGIRLGVEHVDPEMPLTYTLDEAMGYPLQQLGPSPHRKVDGWHPDRSATGADPGDAKWWPRPRVYEHARGVRAIKVCFGMGQEDEEGALQPWLAVLTKAVERVEESDDRLKLTVRGPAEACRAQDGYPVRVQGYRGLDDACAVGWAPRWIRVGRQEWLVPGKRIEINTDTETKCLPDRDHLVRLIRGALGYR